MSKDWMLRVFCLLLALLMIAGFSGCGTQETAEDSTKEEVEEVEQIEEEEEEEEETVEDFDISWTENPTLEMIPDVPIFGEANEEAFNAEAVYFEPVQGRWRMVIADRPLPSDTGTIMGGQKIYINLQEPPETGKTIVREMKYGDGFFQISKKEDRESTTSWNADNAYVIEFTSWDVDEYDPDGDYAQVAGTASGKIFIVYKSTEGSSIDNSWAAGTFTDVIVRYSGTPDFQY